MHKGKFSKITVEVTEKLHCFRVFHSLGLAVAYFFSAAKRSGIFLAFAIMLYLSHIIIIIIIIKSHGLSARRCPMPVSSTSSNFLCPTPSGSVSEATYRSGGSRILCLGEANGAGTFVWRG